MNMEYRLRRGLTRRAVVPALVGVLAVLGVGFALLPGDAPDTVATFVPPDTTAPPTTAAPEPEAAPETLPGTVPTTVAAPPVAEPEPEPAPTTVVETTTTAPAPTTTLAQQETTPIAPPPDPRGDEPGNQIGGIAIPKLGVDEPLLEGIRLTTLDNGPGHWPGTAMPGEVGNVVVAAHRTSHGGPFRHIDQLTEGDTVEFTTEAGLSTYVVTGTMVVNPDATWIVNPTDTPTATLFACHPPGSTAQRIVVNLELQT